MFPITTTALKVQAFHVCFFCINIAALVRSIAVYYEYSQAFQAFPALVYIIVHFVNNRHVHSSPPFPLPSPPFG